MHGEYYGKAEVHEEGDCNRRDDCYGDGPPWILSFFPQSGQTVEADKYMETAKYAIYDIRHIYTARRHEFAFSEFVGRLGAIAYRCPITKVSYKPL